MLVEFPFSGGAFSKPVALRRTKDLKKEMYVLRLLDAFLSGFVLHVKQLGQAAFDV